MADKKPVKDETQSTTRKLPSWLTTVKNTPSEIIPFPGNPPLQVINRFSPLGSTTSHPRPNYLSALVSSYDPFQVTTHSHTQSPVNYTKTSPYLQRSNTRLFMIERCYNHLADPVKMAKAYLPPNRHFIPPHPQKSLQYYTYIYDWPS